MRNYLRGMVIGFVGGFVFIAGCPKPAPPVVNPPDAADAARPRPAPSCSTACAHAEKVCPGSGSPCGPACTRIVDPNYNRCVAAAAGCADLKDCDPLAR